MKKFVLALMGCLLGLGSVKGQTSSLGVDTTGYVFNSTTTFNSTESYKVNIINYGPQPYTGMVTVEYWVDTVGNGTLLTDTLFSDSFSVTSLSTFGVVSDSVTISISNNFRSGINTVVIWPRMSSTPFITHDSLKLQVLVVGWAGVPTKDLVIAQKLFPNPAKQELFIANTDLKFVIEQVRIFDATGKLIYGEKYKGRIDLVPFLPGIYFVEFVSVEGKTNRYKLIKE